MAEFTIPPHGTVCWREHTSQKMNEAKEFYEKLLGWKTEQSKLSPVEYPEIHCGGQAIGGFMKIDEQWGPEWDKMPAHWMTYISTDNCDETVAKVEANGGKICFPAFDAPGVGRIAVLNDPSGAVFSVIQFVKE